MDYQKYTNQMYPSTHSQNIHFTIPFCSQMAIKGTWTDQAEDISLRIKVTFHCLDAIKQINIGVQSLLTNIPLLETVDYLCDFIQNQKINFGIPVMYLEKTYFMLYNLCPISHTCKPDTIADALEYLEEILLTNGYPKQFIKANMKANNARILNYKIPEKLVYLNSQFQDDVSHDIIQRLLDRQIGKSSPAARLRINYSTQRLIPPECKDILNHHSFSKCVYKFTRTCDVRHIGRTMRFISKRIWKQSYVFEVWYTKINKQLNCRTPCG